MFSTRTAISFSRDLADRYTIMELMTADRPGLLNTVGEVFNEMQVDIFNAKIMTIGERAEDAFYVVDEAESPLDENLCDKLQDRLIERLDAESG